MGRPNSVCDCRTAKDFVSVVMRQGGCVEEGARHTIVRGPNGKGRVAIPRHRGDLPTGTRRAIIRELLALGFVVWACACVIAVYAAAAYLIR